MSAVDLVDDAFWPLLVADARAWGADPRDVALVLMSESALDPEAVNPAQRDKNGNPVGGRPNLPAGDIAKACIGLNQLCVGVPENRALLEGMDPGDYQKLPASTQWSAGAGKYFDALLAKHPEAAKDPVALYWLNYKPSTYHANAPDDFPIGPDPNNQLLVLPGESIVTPAGLRHFMDRNLGSARWKAVLAAIDAAENERPLPQGAPTAPTKPAPVKPAATPAGATSDALPIVALAALAFFGVRALRGRKGKA